jgi:hypothetical protein
VPEQCGARPAATRPGPYETCFCDVKDSATSDDEQLELALEVSRLVDRKVERPEHHVQAAVVEIGLSAPPMPDAGEAHRDISRLDDWRSDFCRHHRDCLAPRASGFIEARVRGRQR